MIILETTASIVTIATIVFTASIVSTEIMKYKLLVLISLIVFSTSCQNTKQNSNVKLIDSEELKTILQNNDVQFVDVRTQAEFGENYIKGAENIVFDNNFQNKIDQLDKDKPVVVYCRSGRRSAASAKILEENGFNEVYDLNGGILQWIKEDNEVK
jgi:rhodanese-related sulfurtransferase